MIPYRLLVEIFKLLKANPLVEANPRPMRSLDRAVETKPPARRVDWKMTVVALLMISPIAGGMVGDYMRAQKVREIERQRQQAEAAQPKQHRTFEEIMDQVDNMVLQSTAKSLQADVSAGLKSPQLAASEMELQRAKLRHERLERQAIFSRRPEAILQPSSSTADATEQ